MDAPGDAAAIEQRRQEMLDGLWNRRHELAHELVNAYRSQIDDYRLLSEAVLVRDVAEGAAQNIEGMVQTFRDGFDVEWVDDRWLLRSGARRVRQRVGLPALLRTFRVWGRHLWHAIVELSGDDDVGRRLAIQAGAGVWEYVDYTSSSATTAYIRETSSLATDEYTVPSDVLETLVTGEPVSNHARSQAAAMAVRLPARLVLVVLALTVPDDPPSGRQAAVRAARTHLTPVVTELLVGMLDTEVICICGFDIDEEVAHLDAAVDELAAAGEYWRVGVSRPHGGADGVRASYLEATEAAALGLSHRQPGRAVRFADVLLQQLLVTTRYTDALLGESVRPLIEYDRRRGGSLVATLRAYGDAGFNLTRAASALTVNPNRVYRLRKIHALTGRDTGVLDDLVLLVLGLKLHDLDAPAG